MPCGDRYAQHLLSFTGPISEAGESRHAGRREVLSAHQNPAAEATEIPQYSSLSGSPDGLWAVLFSPAQSSLAREGQMSICLRGREFIATPGQRVSLWWERCRIGSRLL